MSLSTTRFSPKHVSAPINDAWSMLESWKVAEQQRAYKYPGNLARNEQIHDNEKERAGETRRSENKTAFNFAFPESLPFTQRDPRWAFARFKAAVLVCLFQNEEGQIRVILTKRARALSSHSGEVALPGGRRDKEDADDSATALREAREEIGLDPSAVKIVASLEAFISKKLLRVTPVIALLPEKDGFKPAPNPGEVDAVFDAPLDMFLKDKQHRSEDRKWLGYTYRLHYFDFESNNEKYVIYGLTAAILIRCASVVYRQAPVFDEMHLDCFSKLNRQISRL